MQIDWLTVVAQILNFLVLVWLLKRFLYRPIINAMAQREDRIAARLNAAKQREVDAETEAQEYRKKTEALKQAWEERLAEARAEAERERHRWLDEARHDIDRQRETWREELRREQTDFHKTLERQLTASAIRIAERALADLADARLERQVVTAFLRRLGALPEAERKTLAKASAPLRVSSSHELDEETRIHLRTRLREALDAAVDLEYVQDPDLACGIALVGDGHKVEWNIADYMKELEDRVWGMLGTPDTAREVRA